MGGSNPVSLLRGWTASADWAATDSADSAGIIGNAYVSHDGARCASGPSSPLNPRGRFPRDGSARGSSVCYASHFTSSPGVNRLNPKPKPGLGRGHPLRWLDDPDARTRRPVPGFIAEPGRCWQNVYSGQLQATHCIETPRGPARRYHRHRVCAPYSGTTAPTVAAGAVAKGLTARNPISDRGWVAVPFGTPPVYRRGVAPMPEPGDVSPRLRCRGRPMLAHDLRPKSASDALG